MDDKIYSGFVTLLKSRRFLVSVVALVVGVLISYVPELVNVQQELYILLSALALALIGGYSLEDAVTANRTISEVSFENLDELVMDVVKSLLKVDEGSEGVAATAQEPLNSVKSRD